MKIDKAEIGTMSLLVWAGGVVLAKGTWSVLAAIFFPPWAYYLVAELILNTYIIGS